MDPMSGATAFATIVSLIGQFRSERGVNGQAEFNEFLAWLLRTHHDEIKGLVEGNTKATIGIKALLNVQYEELTAKLEMLDNTLASFASGIPSFSELVNGLKADCLLSDQALSILQQFESSGASMFIDASGGQFSEVLFIDAKRHWDEMKLSDPRFIKDDLDSLIESGLLRTDYTSHGEKLYVFTRAASELVRSNES